MKRVLVTGAAGFLGFALAERLARDSATEVFAVDNFVRGERDAAWEKLCSRPNVRGIEADLADPAKLALLPDDFTHLFHLAALNGTQNFYERPYEVLRCCTLPTFHLLDRYGASPVLERFVYAGTSESYASTVTRFGWPVPTDETVPLSVDDVSNPRWSYAASKIHGEVLVHQAMRQFGRPFTVIRYHNAYGPRMGDKHVIPDFLLRAREGVFALHGHEDTRSFLYVDDTIEATLALAACDAAAGQVVNVGSDEELSVLELAQRIMRLMGRGEPVTLHPSPSGSVKRRAPDVGRLRGLTGFAPRWSLDEGLRATIRWYLGDGAVRA